MYRRRVRILPAVLLAALAAGPAVALPLPPSAEEVVVRKLIAAPVGFDKYVFTGEAFPTPTFAPSPDLVKLAGPFAVSATYYDRDGAKVGTAAAPGPYFAVVTVTPKHRPPLTRHVTLYRLARPLDENMPAALGLDSERIDRQAALIADPVNGRSRALSGDDPQRHARRYAGIALTPPAKVALTAQDDADAYERQAWVTLRRKLTGLDKAFPNPVEAPTPVRGKPAPVVREGTEAEAGMKPGTAAKIDAALSTWAADDDHAFAVCVVRRGVIVLHKAYGTRDGKPMTVDTPSWMASVTKPMSASLLLMLADRGLITLDDPVEKFVPALRGLKANQPLLIRHLATHTNGLGKWPSGDDTLDDGEYRVADYYHLLKVGKAWEYNGGGYMLGGKVIENVSGEAVPLFYKRHLLDPLGCTHTQVIGTHADAYSTPLDMAKFGQMLLNRGAYGPHLFFSPATFEAMLPRRLTAELGPDTQKTFGFGLDGRAEKFGHGAASAATFSVDVENELVVIMTRNKFGKNQGKYNGPFWDAITAGIEPKKP